MAGKNLLILPCSKQKKQLDKVTALDLYDGPFYRVAKKFNLQNIDILIVSAKYGLIRSNELISYYDQQMTIERVREISADTRQKLRVILNNNNYNEIFINLGKTYMLVLDDCRVMLEGYSILWANGRIGERLHQLKQWLQSNSIKDDDL